MVCRPRFWVRLHRALGIVGCLIRRWCLPVSRRLPRLGARRSCAWCGGCIGPCGGSPSLVVGGGWDRVCPYSGVVVGVALLGEPAEYPLEGGFAAYAVCAVEPAEYDEAS